MANRLSLTLSLICFAMVPTGPLTIFAHQVTASEGDGVESTEDEVTADLATYDHTIKPLLRKYCVRCHGAGKSEARNRFDNIDPNVVSGEHFDRWEDVREVFLSGEMPPEDQRQPTPKERDQITRWLDTEFKKAKQHGLPNQRGNVRRLTRYELQYALEDLLHVSAATETNVLPEEATSVQTGLKNSSRLLMISGPHLESYLNVILSVINKVKQIAAFEPYAERLDIENLDINPAEAFTRDGRKRKPPVGGLERDGKAVVINSKGYVDLPIPAIARYRFQTLISAKADVPVNLQVAIGFTHSEIDPRQKTASLGVLEVGKSNEYRSYSLDSFPESLPAEMTRALDRPFFIRITNPGRHPLHLKTFDYKGNVNSALVATLVPAEIADSAVEAHVRTRLTAFLERAFRRPPTDAEFTRYFAIYQAHKQNETAIDALLSTYKEIMCSPRFFYVGLGSELPEEQKLNYRLAERLAFFLWCSVPDETLLQAAALGRLTTPSGIKSQVQRMLRDEKSRRWVERFTDQWLQTSQLFNVAVDKNYYPKFRETLKESMHRETIEAVNDVFRNGASAMDLLDADHVFVNQALAAHYQIKGVRGPEFQKVAIDANVPRGGLLTQGTFLIGNSDGMNSHAILRGVWLSEVILNDPPPDPPKNVPPLDESIPGFDKMTLNQKLFAHRNNDACKGCHQKIDPWGIPFENYDASGAWREQVLVISQSTVTSKAVRNKRKRKRPVFEKSYVAIDRQATLPDQSEVSGIEELKQYLINRRSRDFAQGLTERILAYALSRDIDYHDEDLLDRLVDDFETSDYSVPHLIGEIVQSEAFR